MKSGSVVENENNKLLDTVAVGSYVLVGRPTGHWRKVKIGAYCWDKSFVVIYGERHQVNTFGAVWLFFPLFMPLTTSWIRLAIAEFRSNFSIFRTGDFSRLIVALMCELNAKILILKYFFSDDRWIQGTVDAVVVTTAPTNWTPWKRRRHRRPLPPDPDASVSTSAITCATHRSDHKI